MTNFSFDLFVLLPLLHNHPAVFFAVHVGGEVAFVDSDDVAAPGFPFGAFEPVDVEDVAVFAGEDGHVEDAVYFEVGEEVRAVGELGHVAEARDAELDHAEAVGELAVLDWDAELGAAGTDAAGCDEDVGLAARGFVELAYEARGAVEVAALEV